MRATLCPPVLTRYRRQGSVMKTCPACRSAINVDATRCPRCQTDFDGAAMEAGRAEVRGRTRRKLILLALLFAGLIAWLAWPGNVERLGEAVAEMEAS